MSYFLMVSTKKHPIKAYNLKEVLKHAKRDPKGFDKFDKEWGHSKNIINALEEDTSIEFLNIG